MKYRYVVGFVAALSFNNGFAMDIDYANAYRTITAADGTNAATRINAALAGRADFDTNLDSNVARRILTNYELRKLVIGLGIGELQTVVEANHKFFKRSFGMHLLLCNVLNRFTQPGLPCYIMEGFSFRTYFERLTDQIVDDATRIFFKSRFTLGLFAIDANKYSRFEFQARNYCIPYEIEQVGAPGVLSIDGVIDSCYLDDEAIAQERLALLIEPVRAPHLLSIVADHTNDTKLGCTTLTETQECILLRPDLFGVRTKEQEVLLSLPADTPNTYVFMGKSVTNHITACREIAAPQNKKYF